MIFAGPDFVNVHFAFRGVRRSVGNGHSFSTDTSVALIMAKTLSPSLRFIRLTEPVVLIDATFPAAVRMRSSDSTLSETIFSILPARRFRILVLMVDSFPQLAQVSNARVQDSSMTYRPHLFAV